jgi:hypothetical protein
MNTHNPLATQSNYSTFLRKARTALSSANSFPEILELRSQAETIRQYIKRIGESLELQNAAAEVKLRAERKAGEILSTVLKRGGNPKSHDVTLRELRISKMQSSRLQAISSIPQKTFESHIEQMKLGKELTTSSALKLAREISLKNRRSEHMARASKMPSKGFGVIQGSYRALWTQLEDNAVDLFFSDPPYAKNQITCYLDLAELAAAKLKPGGLCLAYSGQMFLPEVIDAMRTHLEYWWIFAIQFAGKHSAIHPRAIQNKWRSILAFAKPPLRKSDEWLSDLLSGGGRSKERDDWEQEESEAEYLVRKLTKANDLVVDPFAGTGTFLVAAKKQGRRWLGTEIDPLKAKLARSRLK